MKILVLGATGMLGNAVFRYFREQPGFDTHGTVRSEAARRHFAVADEQHLHTGVDALDFDSLISVFARIRPDVVVNAIGVIKQLASANDPLHVIPINSLFPHRLARLCGVAGTRLVHVSTDCVFSGSRGRYRESDQPDAYDLYGRSKLLGEVDYPHAITLRTSIIGHELGSAHALVDWFLSQTGKVKGFRKAIFSGLPTIELARVIQDAVLPRPELHGLYHVAAAPINKYDLLSLVARTYNRNIQIDADDSLVIDRSLISERFTEATGYRPAEWPALISDMKEFG